MSKKQTGQECKKSKSILFYLVAPFVFVFTCIKSLFSVTKMPLKTNGFLEYAFYKEYARYKFLVLIFCIFLSMFFIARSKEVSFFDGSGYIARITIDGVITSDEGGYGGVKFYEDVIRKAIENKDIKGVIVYINSVGGEVTASEILYTNLLKLAIVKPTFCDIGSVGASGGYMAALACKKIYAKQTSSVGSIGVKAGLYEVGDLAKKIGINLNIMTSGDLKAAGDPWKKMSEKELLYINKMLGEVHMFFINLVAKERGLSIDFVKKIADGSVVMGSEAKDLGLIDSIGDQSDILKEMIRDYGFSSDIAVDDLTLEQKGDGCFNVRKLIGVFTSSLVQDVKKNLLYSRAEFSY